MEIKKFSDWETLERKKRGEKCFCNWKLISKITIYRLLMNQRNKALLQKTKRQFNSNNNKLWKSVQLLINNQEPPSSKSLPTRMIKNWLKMEHSMMKLKNSPRQPTRLKASSKKQLLMPLFNFWLRKTTLTKKRKFQLKKNGVFSCTSTMTANATTWRAPASKKAKHFTDKEAKTQPPSS